MITTVTYARLYNIGNFENIRLEATAAIGVDGDVEAAFNEAREAVEAQYETFQARREEEAQRQRGEWSKAQKPQDDVLGDLFP